MKKINFRIGIIIVLVAGLITAGLDYFLLKQIPEMPEIIEKPAKQNMVKPETVYLSSDQLGQGDTLLIKIKGKPSHQKFDNRGKPTSQFELTKIDFFEAVTFEGWVGILGIDVKEKPGKHNLVINFSDGNKIKKEVTVIERKFPITELLVTRELKEKGYTPSNIIKNITTKENMALKEIFGIYTPEAYFSQAFINPLEKIEVVGDYGDIRKSENLAIQHLGVDLKAPLGTPIYAINDGVVRFSKDLRTYGKILIIDHGLGIFSVYLHLDEFKVWDGKPVKRGEIIGLSGNTGYSIGPHLHFSVKVNQASVDPLRFINTMEKELK